MPYCTIDEAWGTLEEFGNKDSILDIESPSSETVEDYTLNNEKISKVVNYSRTQNTLPEHITNVSRLYDTITQEQQQQNIKDTSPILYNSSQCSEILRHIAQCNECKNTLMHQDNTYTHIYDTLVFVISGIFIIFVLDTFVKLGKNFKT